MWNILPHNCHPQPRYWETAELHQACFLYHLHKVVLRKTNQRKIFYREKIEITVQWEIHNTRENFTKKYTTNTSYTDQTSIHPQLSITNQTNFLKKNHLVQNLNLEKITLSSPINQNRFYYKLTTMKLYHCHKQNGLMNKSFNFKTNLRFSWGTELNFFQ